MGERTAIEWCDSTVNPTPCCTGCELYPDHCYAARLHKVYDGHNPGWPKSFTEPTYFEGRIKAAARWSDLRGKKRLGKPWLDGMPRLIFVDDMGDPFAPFDDPAWSPELHLLHPLLDRIEHSPHIWLLLTKWPDRFAEFAKHAGGLPRNLWGATTVTSQETTWRIGHLLTIDLAVRFLSIEPLLGPVDLSKCTLPSGASAHPLKVQPGHYPLSGSVGPIHWIAVGGESGPGARVCNIENIRLVLRQCRESNVRAFVKQLGSRPFGKVTSFSGNPCDLRKDRWIFHPKGGDPAEWPEDLRIREFLKAN